MPKRSRSYSKASKAKKYKKKRAYSRSELVRYGSGISKGLPQGQYVVMKYSTNLNLVDAVTGLDFHVFRGNSIFDPDFTGVGHQPLGHDQWAQLYRQYQVNWATIDILFADQLVASATTRPSLVGVYASTSSAGPTSTDTLPEFPISRHQYLGTIEAGPQRLSLKCSTGDIVGDPMNKFDKNYTATFGASPVSEWFFTVVANSESLTNVNLDARITITYYCWLFDPVALTSS